MPVHLATGANYFAGIVAADISQSSNSSYSNLFTKAVLANEKWVMEACLFFSAAAATTGIVVAMDAPANPAAVIYGLDSSESATTFRCLVATSAGTALVGTASAAATIITAFVRGTVENGPTAGNVVVKFRSEVNGSAVTVKRGSFVRWSRV